MKRTFLTLICLICWNTACQQEPFTWRALDFQNLSDVLVQFRTRGIQLYERGIQNFDGYNHPNTWAGYNTYEPLRLSYPIQVSWRSGDMLGETKEYNKIPGIPEGQEVVETAGFLIVGLSPDYELRIFFLPGERRHYELADQIIRGEVPLPE